MLKYLQKHKESSDRRVGHPALADFYRSLEYGDRKALKEFLKDSPMFLGDREQAKVVIREVMRALLQGEYYQEVGVLEQRLGMENVVLAMEENQEMKRMYEGYRNRGTKKAQKRQNQEANTTEGSSVAKTVAGVALFSAIIAVVTFFVRYRRLSKQQKPPIAIP